MFLFQTMRERETERGRMGMHTEKERVRDLVDSQNGFQILLKWFQIIPKSSPDGPEIIKTSSYEIQC
jgi:hypothetical protein